LAFEEGSDHANKIIYNSFDYLISRYQLDPASTDELREKYNEDMSTPTNGLPQAPVPRVEFAREKRTLLKTVFYKIDCS
jgi:hypothetical protein